MTAAGLGSIRHDSVRRAKTLEYVTVAYNSLEALIALAAGVAAGSAALVCFGLDSIIEVTSGGALLWRLHQDADVSRRNRIERTALRITGWCFAALALYVLFESGSALILRHAPERSIPGIIVAAVSVVAMPLLARAKRRVASELSSAALHADSRQADFCASLSAILLGGLLLNALFGWWWADPVAGLVMAPVIGKEGFDALRGKACGCAGE